MIYLTGSSNAAIMGVARGLGLGLLLQPGARYQRHLDRFPVWAADNGCFAQGARFDVDAWLTWLGGLPCRETCLFATAPDVLGDARATLTRSAPLIEAIRVLGYRPALVAQDGLENLPVPWDTFEALFVGGYTRWKLSAAVGDLVREARARGKWVHMGRVNSLQRLRAADLIGCDSADGTFIKFGPDVNLPRLRTWLEQLRVQPALFGGRAERR